VACAPRLHAVAGAPDWSNKPAFVWNLPASGWFGSQCQSREMQMGWILTIIIGGILGWLASKVMRTDAQQGIILNIVVGVVGAALAGFLLSPLLGIPTINAANFSIGGLLISFLGALILLAIVNLIRRGRAR
jgi:uncharacterized membrane protein YeaQ/YmgE (transglycosylase-associated protein family)